MLGLGEGLPGRVLLTGEPTWIRDPPTDTNFPRAQVAADAGLNAAFGFPLHSPRGILGVMEFFTREDRAPTKPAASDWTVLAFLAGDNNLEGPLLGNIYAMERVGSRPGSVEIVAQIDRAPGYDTSDGGWSGTRRYYITRSATPKLIGSTWAMPNGS